MFLGLTRKQLRRAGYVAGGLALLALALGYLVGLMFRPISYELPASPHRRPLAPAAQVQSGGLPGWQDLYVNDYAGLLSRDAEANLRDRLTALYDETGIEMTLLTIRRRADYGAAAGNEAFATALFNAWGIGDATRNDGVLILVSRLDRDMRIELGAGYGSSRDRDMARVIDDAFLPAFRRDAYETGIIEGVDETIRSLTGVYPGLYDQSVIRRGWGTIGHWLSGLGTWLFGLLAIPAGGALWLWRRVVRYRPRTCTVCGTGMVLQTEEADDAHLSGGQQLEEFIGSVDYDIWECPSCAHKQFNRYPAWFSGYGACPQCSFKTLSSTTEVLRAATTSSTGLKRIDYACQNCNYANSEERTIPKVSKSSSSGSSRSSFGGGRSSGGGASGSW